MRFRRALVSIQQIVSENKLASILIILASFLRFYRFSEFVTFLGDQGRDAIIIKRILTFEHFPAIGAPTSIGQIYLGPFFYYLMSPFLLLSNFDPLGLALGCALLSLIGITLAYIFIKKELGITTALLFLLFAALSSTNIELARFSWNPNLLPIFSFFTLYFFYKALTTKKGLVYSALFGSFLSFSIQLHYLAFLLLVPIIIVFLKEIVVKKNFVMYVNSVLISLVFFAFFSLPLFIFDLRHGFLNSKNFIKLFQGGTIVASTSYLTRLTDTATGLYKAVFVVPTVHPTLTFAFLTVLISLYIAVRNKSKNHLFTDLLFLNVLSYIVLFAVVTSPRYPHYFGSLYFSLYVILGYILSQGFKSNVYKILGALFVIFYIWINASNYYFFVNSPNNQIQKAKDMAQVVKVNITSRPYQIVSLPYTETDSHVRYFLELWGARPLKEDFFGQPKELFVLCFEPKCSVLGNPQWQIASFKYAKIDKIIRFSNLTIYRLIHER